MKSGWTLQRIAEPPEEPVSLDEVKRHCRVDVSEDDEQLESLIVSARIWAENFCRRAFVEQTWKLSLARFPYHPVFGNWFPSGRIELPVPPFIELLDFRYVNELGNAAVFTTDQYRLETDRGLAVLAPPFYEAWPLLLNDWNGIAVTYRAGYKPLGSPVTDESNTVPEPIKTAIKLHVEAHYDRDIQSMNMLLSAARDLLASFRVYRF